MFNTVTAEQIKSLPPVEDVNVERLPELLSKIYAHILGLQTKYGEGQLSFVDREINLQSVIQRIDARLHQVAIQCLILVILRLHAHSKHHQAQKQQLSHFNLSIIL